MSLVAFRGSHTREVVVVVRVKGLAAQLRFAWMQSPQCSVRHVQNRFLSVVLRGMEAALSRTFVVSGAEVIQIVDACLLFRT